MKLSDIDDVEVIALAARWADGADQFPVFGFLVPGVVDALIETGIPPKLALRKVERLVDRDLLDYGVSPHYAWPTPEGLTLLRAVGGEASWASG